MPNSAFRKEGLTLAMLSRDSDTIMMMYLAGARDFIEVFKVIKDAEPLDDYLRQCVEILMPLLHHWVIGLIQ
jgi:hypothetical protein